jgi:hypothetical protein
MCHVSQLDTYAYVRIMYQARIHEVYASSLRYARPKKTMKNAVLWDVNAVWLL